MGKKDGEEPERRGEEKVMKGETKEEKEKR